MGPCAKQRVTAVVEIKGSTGPLIVGENVCLKPQQSCPRVPGEAYAKCITECGQLGHAEEVALRQVRMAGYLPSDVASIAVYGHSGPCDHCRAVLRDSGLLDVTRFYPGVQIPALSQVTHDAIAVAYNLERPSSHSSAAKDADVTA